MSAAHCSLVRDPTVWSSKEHGGFSLYNTRTVHNTQGENFLHWHWKTFACKYLWNYVYNMHIAHAAFWFLSIFTKSNIHLVFSYHGLFCCSWRWCCGVVELNGSQTAWNISWPVFFQLSLACQIIYTSPLYPTLTHNTKYTQHILPSACSCLYPCYHNCTTFTKPIQL